MESFLSNGKAVDLVLRKDGEVTFVEIAISPPLEKEIKNIIKDLQGHPPPDRLVLVARDGKSKTKLMQLVEADDKLEPLRQKIEITLAGSFFKANRTDETILTRRGRTAHLGNESDR